MRYSKDKGCFFPRSINYPELPADLINVTQADYAAAMARGPGDRLDVVDGRVVVVLHVETLANIQATAVVRIKAKAGDVILRRLPGWKQANLTARALELLSAAETGSSEWAGIQDQWAWVKAVRSFSDQSEAAVMAALDQPEVAVTLATALAGLEAIQ